MPFLLTAPTQPGTGNPPGSTAAWSAVDADCVCIASGEVTGFDVSVDALVGIPLTLEANDRYQISTRNIGAGYPIDAASIPVVFSLGGVAGESQVRLKASALVVAGPVATATVNWAVYRALS